MRVPPGDSAGLRALRARLRAAGVSVEPASGGGSGSGPILVPLDLPAADQAAAAKLDGKARLLLVGSRQTAQAALLERADAILPDPCEGAALVAALTGKTRARPPAPRDAAAPLRILAADDVATNRLLLEKMLADPARELVLVEDGDVAVERFAAGGFDLVLMDISMPRMDGREASRRIRSMPAGASVPIIAMTAHADPDEIADIHAAGADEVMTKPIRKPDLMKLLDRLAARMGR